MRVQNGVHRAHPRRAASARRRTADMYSAAPERVTRGQVILIFDFFVPTLIYDAGPGDTFTYEYSCNRFIPTTLYVVTYRTSLLVTSLERGTGSFAFG